MAAHKFSSKLKSHHFSADWVWKGIVFGAWHVVVDADGNLGLLDISNALINWSDPRIVGRSRGMISKE